MVVKIEDTDRNDWYRITFDYGSKTIVMSLEKSDVRLIIQTLDNGLN